MRAIALPPRWQELVLSGAGFMILPVLVLAPRGATAVVCVAGAAAASLAWRSGWEAVRGLRKPAVLVGLLVLLGALSLAWSITPLRSLEMAVRIGGLTAAGLGLIAAAPVATTRWIPLGFFAGAALAIACAAVEVATGGALSQLFFVRPFAATRMNEAATTMAVLLLPVAASPATRVWRGLPIALAVLLAAMIALLSGTTAQLAAVIGVAAFGLFYLDRRRTARLAAGLSVLVVLSAPLTFPRLAESPRLLASADTLKTSAAHRLLIWQFVGARIADRPLLGWGLDTSRAIPGGKEWVRPYQERLPLHPHNAALQLWLELGIPGALLGALLVAATFWAVAAAGWPRLYGAAVGGALSVAMAGLMDCFSLWNESWQAALWFSVFLVLVMGRPAAYGAAAVTTAPARGAVAARP